MLQYILLFGIFAMGIRYIWKNHLEIVEISGTSMYPTYEHGELVVLRKSFWTLKEGDIYCYTTPHGVTAIKRLIRFEPCSIIPNGYICWFEGDNQVKSLDSRVYGYVHSGEIEGKILRSRKRGHYS